MADLDIALTLMRTSCLIGEMGSHIIRKHVLLKTDSERCRQDPIQETQPGWASWRRCVLAIVRKAEEAPCRARIRRWGHRTQGKRMCRAGFPAP